MKNVHLIPPTNPQYSELALKRVALYCRVSSTKKPQLRSLGNQISGLTQYVYRHVDWRLVDVYIDYESGADDNRDGFKRMLSDAAQGLIDIVIIKSSSRLGRNTVDVLSACRKLKGYNCDVYFQNADTFFSDAESTLALEISAGIDQGENEDRAASIRWGINRGLEDGTSGYYTRPFFGYHRDDDGELSICEDEAIVVRKIFSMYISGASIVKIKQELEDRGFRTPTGKEQWPKKTIEHILTNSKYCGIAVITSSESAIDGRKTYQYISEGNNPAIITADVFASVQEEMKKRSNIVVRSDGTKVRKNTHYSAKRNNRLKHGYDD